MSTNRKKPNTVSADKPETVIVKAFVRISEDGEYYISGWGDSEKPTPAEDILEELENYYMGSGSETYQIEIEVPAYTRYSAAPRFKLKASD